MDEKRGIIIVFTGDGKGKTTAALGISLRAQGRKKRTLFLQFMKGKEESGEQLLDGSNAPLIEIRAFGAGFLKKGGDREPHRKAVEEGWERAARELSDGGCDILVLDEISHVINLGLLSVEEVVKTICERRQGLHLVLTGRSMPQALIDLADTVTEMKEIRHAFHAGTAAIGGIDY